MKILFWWDWLLHGVLFFDKGLIQYLQTQFNWLRLQEVLKSFITKYWICCLLKINTKNLPDATFEPALATDLKFGMGRSRVTIGTGNWISVPPSGNSK